MEALLRQSRSMCPFLKKTSPATLRSLSTTSAHNASPGGGSMSNLQVLARRCPIMGKALAVQSARTGNAALAGAYGGARAYHSKVPRATLHTTAPKEAQAVDVGSARHQAGMSFISPHSTPCVACCIQSRGFQANTSCRSSLHSSPQTCHSRS